MSNKSGVAEQVITLAKGGGELKGLGESFSPDLHTGTGNFNIPIALPVGRNGFQPELGLTYSTGNGNTCLGLGWQLNIPGVSRKTSKGIPRYLDEGKTPDTFLLSGAEDLIPVEKKDNWIRYRPRTEGLFALIRRYKDQDNDYWEVKSKDGILHFYGQSPFLNIADSATVYNPAIRDHIFSWHLVETRDVFGNRIIYEYERDSLNEGQRHSNQIYLKRIKYLDYEDENGQVQFLASVVFDYELDRPDPFSVYTSGFEIRTRRRCSRISTFTHPVPEQAILVKTYSLAYITTPFSNTSLLQTVQVKGHDKEKEEALPPLTFSYTSFAPTGREFKPLTGNEFPSQSLANDTTDLIDLFGNGLPDIVQLNGVVRYWKNIGSGQFDSPRIMKQAPAGISLSDSGIQFMDANGEGKADLVIHKASLSGYFPTTFNGTWDQQSFVRHRKAPSFSLKDPNVKLFDLNGDGITDALRTSNSMEAFLNDSLEGWHDMIITSRQDMERFPNVNFSDPRVRIADMTGDSLQDIVFINGNSVAYWPNMGYNKWGKRMTMKNARNYLHVLTLNG